MENRMRILIAEKNKSLVEMFKTLLVKSRFDVDVLYDSPLVYDYVSLEIYDLLILSEQLASRNFYSLIRHLRKDHFGLPILVLSSCPSTAKRISALNAGADYYLEIGCEPQELLACIYALLRRNGSQINEISYGNTSLNLTSATLSCGERSVRLTAKEFHMIRLFFQNPSRNLTKDMLLSYLWGYESNATENHVEVYVGFLRKKLKEIRSDVSIVTLRKLGYHLEIN